MHRELAPGAEGRSPSASNSRVGWQTESFAKLNIRASWSASQWERLPAEINANACLILGRLSPKICVMLIAEQVGPEVKFNRATLLTVSQAIMREKWPNATYGKESDEVAAGMSGVQYEVRLSNGTENLCWNNWSAAHNGYVYQVVTFGLAEDADKVAATAREFRKNLQLIDPDRVSECPNKALIARQRSAAFGFEIDLTDLGWVGIDCKDKLAATQFSAFGGNGDVVVICATPMPGRSASPELLKKAFLARSGFGRTGDEIVRTTPYRAGKWQCEEIEAWRTLNGERTPYCMRIVASERCAYFLVGWQIHGTRQTLGGVRDALNRFTILADPTIEQSKLSEGQQLYAGLALNEVGLACHENGDYVMAIDFFNLARKLSPKDPAITSNYLELLLKLDRADEALAALKEVPADLRNTPRYRAMQARLLAKKGKVEDSTKLYEQVFADGCTDEQMLAEFVGTCTAAERYDDALAAIEAVLQRKPTLVVERLQATMLSLKGDHEKAIAKFREIKHRNPTDIVSALDLTVAYHRAKEYDAALQITQGLIDAGNQEEMVLALHGRSQLYKRDTAAAKQTSEKILKLYPESSAGSDLLRVASSQLGQGDNTGLRTPIEPVEMPAAIQAAMTSAANRPSAAAEEYGAEELTRVSGIAFEQDKPVRKTMLRRIKIYGQSGVTQFSTLTFKYEPLGERVFINRLVVLDEHGKQVSQGSVDSYFVTDDQSKETACNAKVINVPVPGLKAGYTLECQITREDIAPSKAMPFEQTALSSTIPIKVSAFFVQGDLKAVKWVASPGVKLEQNGNALFCVAANPLLLRVEPNQPEFSTFAPAVWVGPADSSWEELGHQYLALVDDRLLLDDRTREFAKTITQGCSTKLATVAAVAAHVQQAYTYKAIEFGRRAQIPNAAATTLELKYGDCKDHALLTKQLLEAAGIHAHLSLVNSSGIIVERLPSLDQFDHMVVFVPASEIGIAPNAIGGLLIDATAKEADPLAMPPYGLSDQPILVLDPQQPHMIHTPKYPADGGLVATERHVTFRIIGTSRTVDAVVEERATFNGYFAPGLRRFFRHGEPGNRRESLQTVLSQGSEIHLNRLDIQHLDEPTVPLVVETSYVVPHCFHAVTAGNGGKQLVGNLPSTWENEYLDADYTDSRKTPFEFKMPRRVHSSLSIEVPNGYELTGLEHCSATGSTQFVAWSSHSERNGNRIQIEYDARLLPGCHPAGEYEQFYADVNDSLAPLHIPVTLQEVAPQMAARPTDAPLIR
jgi:tetratricopeptide (TPR) repeat protein